MAGSRATVRVDNQYTPTFPITNGVRQGDALPSILFDLVLEAITRKLNITGHIGTKSTQIFVYANDVAILSRNKNALKDGLGNIESAARERDLIMNENKTKYMEVTRTVVNGNHLQCRIYEFEHVKELFYLGSQLNQTNSANCEIQTRIISGNRCNYSCGTLMKSRALNRSLKLKIYKTLLRPAVTYGCEAWTLTNRNEQQLRIFEQKILRKIFGPVQDENGIWRIRKNHELNELVVSSGIIRFIKSRRMAWLGHIMRMDGGRMPRRILEWKPMGGRIRGRPRKRWIEDGEEDIQMMGIRGWRKLSKEWMEWK